MRWGKALESDANNVELNRSFLPRINRFPLPLILGEGRKNNTTQIPEYLIHKANLYFYLSSPGNWG